jgi:hypothetical protein
MDMISFPIRFDSSGFVKLTEGTTDYYSQLLSICMLTEPGTHPFTPSFGANDPAFTNIDKSLFILNASQFVPEIELTNIDISDKDKNAGTTRISVSFNINAAQG